MDVYFIPVAPDHRYELYCEPDEKADEGVDDDLQPQGRLATLYANFKEALARVEEERLSGEMRVHDGPRSWSERMKDRALCWIVEKIAEQRLLWRLRNETELCLHHPDDLTTEDAIRRARAELQREADRHMKWVIIDGVLFVASAALVLVPGPNVIGYYFGFRLVGHYLSRRGARHALTRDQLVRVCEPPALTLASCPRAWARRARSRGARSRVGPASPAPRQVLRADCGQNRVISSLRKKRQEIRSSGGLALLSGTAEPRVARGGEPATKHEVTGACRTTRVPPRG